MSIVHLIASICTEYTETTSVIEEFWSDERDLTVGARVRSIDMPARRIGLAAEKAFPCDEAV